MSLFDVELEEHVIGAILSDPLCFRTVATMVRPEYFNSKELRAIYSACESISLTGGEPDIASVTHEMKNKEPIVDIVRLSDIASSNPTSANIDYLCSTLTGLALKRGLLRLSMEISDKVQDSQQKAEDIAYHVRSKITDAFSQIVRGRTATTCDLALKALSDIEILKASGKKWSGLTTGISAIDHKLRGLKKGDLIILAARPSMGKTALAINMASGIARIEKRPVGIMSLEMGGDQLIMRMLSTEAKIESWRLQEGAIDSHHQEKLNQAATKISELQILIQDEPSIGIQDFEAQAQILSLKHNVCCLFVDYLQLFTAKTDQERKAGTQGFTAMISKSMKSVARSLQIPVIALSQLSRAPEIRGGDRRPMLSDLRDSGAIEQDADVVIFLYRPEYYDKALKKVTFADKEYDANGFAEAIISKHRNGAVGSVALHFTKEFTEFRDFDFLDSPSKPSEEKLPF